MAAVLKDTMKITKIKEHVGAEVTGVDLRKPLVTSLPLQKALGIIRGAASFWDRDRAFSPDLERMRTAVEAGEFAPIVALDAQSVFV